jgi:hypothetical protein
METLKIEPIFKYLYWKNINGTLVKKTQTFILDTEGREVLFSEKTEGFILDGAIPLSESAYEEYKLLWEESGNAELSKLHQEEEEKRTNALASLQKLGLTLEEVNTLFRR